ncbi:adenine phosphoribosyltransferase [bacterium]|nr:adenine phosphoribosyltransferase [bacterium]
MAADNYDLLRYMRVIEDYPKKGISFKDITTLLKVPEAFDRTVQALADHFRASGVTCVCGLESRGFIFGAAVARELGVGFVPVRKPGKLPYKVISEEYTLEYGTNTLEMHTDALCPEDKVLIIDDLIATGGSAQAAAKLVKRLGAKLAGFGFVMELSALKGRELLEGSEVFSLIVD